MKTIANNKRYILRSWAHESEIWIEMLPKKTGGSIDATTIIRISVDVSSDSIDLRKEADGIDAVILDNMQLVRRSLERIYNLISEANKKSIEKLILSAMPIKMLIDYRFC
jgi:hypothetical protein